MNIRKYDNEYVEKLMSDHVDLRARVKELEAELHTENEHSAELNARIAALEKALREIAELPPSTNRVYFYAGAKKALEESNEQASTKKEG